MILWKEWKVHREHWLIWTRLIYSFSLIWCSLWCSSFYLFKISLYAFASRLFCLLLLLFSTVTSLMCHITLWHLLACSSSSSSSFWKPKPFACGAFGVRRGPEKIENSTCISNTKWIENNVNSLSKFMPFFSHHSAELKCICMTPHYIWTPLNKLENCE